MNYPTFESMYMSPQAAPAQAKAPANTTLAGEPQDKTSAPMDPSIGMQDAGANPWDQHMDLWASSAGQNVQQQESGKK
jgi:hypothetical protein